MIEFLIKERSNEPLPFDLLLLADPSKKMIDRYLIESEIFLARSEDQVVGALVLKRTGNVAEIMNVAVDEKHQGKGIGSALIRYAIQTSKKARLEKMLIGTADTSKDQLHLYQKLGFKRVNKITNFFVDHYDEPIFENGKQARDMIRLEMSLT